MSGFGLMIPPEKNDKESEQIDYEEIAQEVESDEKEPDIESEIDDHSKSSADNNPDKYPDEIPSGKGGDDDEPDEYDWFDGEVLVIIGDAILSKLSSIICLYVFKINAPASMFQIDEREQKILTILTEKAAEEYLSKLSPIQQLLIALGSIYGSKIAQVAATHGMNEEEGVEAYVAPTAPKRRPGRPRKYFKPEDESAG